MDVIKKTALAFSLDLILVLAGWCVGYYHDRTTMADLQNRVAELEAEQSRVASELRRASTALKSASGTAGQLTGSIESSGERIQSNEEIYRRLDELIAEVEAQNNLNRAVDNGRQGQTDDSVPQK